MIIDRPTGERQSSPVVCSRYPMNSHASATMPRSSAVCAPYQNAPKPRPSCNKPERELDRRARLEPAFAQKSPERGEHQPEDQDVHRIDRLEPACGNLLVALGDEHADVVGRHGPVDRETRIVPIGIAQGIELVDREDSAAVGIAELFLRGLDRDRGANVGACRSFAFGR